MLSLSLGSLSLVEIENLSNYLSLKEVNLGFSTKQLKKLFNEETASKNLTFLKSTGIVQRDFKIVEAFCLG